LGRPLAREGHSMNRKKLYRADGTGAREAMEITGGEQNTYLGWRSYVLSLPKPFYTLKAV
jgi:hypothetical protein